MAYLGKCEYSIEKKCQDNIINPKSDIDATGYSSGKYSLYGEIARRRLERAYEKSP